MAVSGSTPHNGVLMGSWVGWPPAGKVTDLQAVHIDEELRVQVGIAGLQHLHQPADGLGAPVELQEEGHSWLCWAVQAWADAGDQAGLQPLHIRLALEAAPQKHTGMR